MFDADEFGKSCFDHGLPSEPFSRRRMRALISFGFQKAQDAVATGKCPPGAPPIKAIRSCKSGGVRGGNHLQFQCVSPHGGEMRPSRDEADVGACACELYSEISADRTGAVDTDFHGVLRTWGTEMPAELTRWL
jgi:hypothetical protein